MPSRLLTLSTSTGWFATGDVYCVLLALFAGAVALTHLAGSNLGKASVDRRLRVNSPQRIRRNRTTSLLVKRCHVLVSTSETSAIIPKHVLSFWK